MIESRSMLPDTLQEQPIENVDRLEDTTTSNDVDKNQLTIAIYSDYGRSKENENSDETSYYYDAIPINYSWSSKILQLVMKKCILMHSFSWFSTIGGGFSSLGERHARFSLRAGHLSLNQQLVIAERLGDDRLKTMCHMFAALAALQLRKKSACLMYLKQVIIPLMRSLPFEDEALIKMFQYLVCRMKVTRAELEFLLLHSLKKTDTVE